MDPRLFSDIVPALASRHGWKCEHRPPRLVLCLDADTSVQLALDSPVLELDLSSESSVTSSPGFPAVLELLSRQSLHVPRFGHLRYLKTESEEEALQAIEDQIQGMPGTSSGQVVARALRMLVRVSFRCLRARQRLYLGIHLFEHNLSRCFPFDSQFLVRDLVRREHWPLRVDQKELQEALKQLLALLEWDLREECESAAQYLVTTEAVEAKRATEFYDRLRTQGLRCFGLPEGREFSSADLDRECARVLKDIENRYSLSVEVLPISISVIECSMHLFQGADWKIAKLPFLLKVLTSVCARCGVARDRMRLGTQGLQCLLCT